MDKSLANFKQNPEAQFLVLVINPINHGLYENLLTMGGHMAPQPENALNLKVGGKTYLCMYPCWGDLNVWGYLMSLGGTSDPLSYHGYHVTSFYHFI